jgi:hypothetical protein
MWFLARVSKEATVVLDEPDVYLHADLQRKLIKVIEGLEFKQSITATHSSEIIGDVPFQNVVVIQKSERVSRPSDNASEIQKALTGMGSLHSIQLAKVAQRGLILFVEGDDKPFLTDIAYKLGSRAFDAFSSIAVQEIKGKGNWTYAIGAAKALHAASGGEINTCLLLDRDYMLKDERLKHYQRAADEGLILKIWKRKEIENYFVCPKVIARYIAARTDETVSVAGIQSLIDATELEVKNDVILSYADVIQKHTQPRIEPKTAYKRAENEVDRRLADGFRICDLASGKDFIAALASKSHKAFGVSLTPLALCKEMRESECPEELRQFVTALSKPGSLTPNIFTEQA